ncbi:signal peptidase I [Verrucomicrobiales bacterium]|nr:signal peptidase I [Verrucomicrobiales bacterium]
MAKQKNQKGAPEKKENPNANEPITRKHAKRAKMLMKDVKRFLRYNNDLIAEPQREKITELESNFQDAFTGKSTTQKELSDSAEALTKTCEKSVKGYKSSAIRENVESFFVVIVIVMAFRTYFAQPFKIPTGSMQPTLNGVIAYPQQSPNWEKPGLFTQIKDKVWYGRSYVKKVAKEDTQIGSLKQRQFLLFFTQTMVKDPNGKTLFTIPGTSARVTHLMQPGGRRGRFFYPKGSVIAQGYIDTGDQVFVDRFSYHWIKPKRGDVFVFNTRDIAGIQNGVDPKEGSQHYIKRLVGTPGNELKWDSPNLFINGEKAKEFGMARVMSLEGEYTVGYTRSGDQDLGPKEYMAMGDNSANSSDSRDWGIVPERNIVGRGLFVFLPFGHHFGPIR